MKDDTPVLWDEVPAERLCGTCTRLRPVAEFGTYRYCNRCRRATTRRHRGVHPIDADREPKADDTCEVCDGDGGRRGLFLDHNHSTGRFRGWLCHACNAAIGHLKDDPRLLESAIRYLTNEAG